MTYFAIIIAIISALTLFFISRWKKREARKVKESKKKEFEQFIENADKFTFSVADIISESGSFYKEKLTEESSTIIDDLLGAGGTEEESIFCTEVIFAFDYKGVNIKTKKIFPMDQFFLDIHFAKYPMVDIYIQELELYEDEHPDTCWDELNYYSESLYYTQEKLYQYHMSWINWEI